MSWTRLSDDWCEQRGLQDLGLDARWHLLCLIQFCSRTGRYDGVVRLGDAQRASDVPNAGEVVQALLAADYLQSIDGGQVRVVGIDQHVPPPSMRDGQRKERRRVEKSRSRGHARGDHSACLSKNCSQAPVADVSTGVSTDAGTGQDDYGSRRESSSADTSAALCRVCGNPSGFDLLDGRCRRCLGSRRAGAA